MLYLIKVTLSTTKTNVTDLEGRVLNWFYRFSPNEIIAYSYITLKSSDIDCFDALSQKKLNLGVLIDVLTFCINTNVNTDIAISADSRYKLYPIPNKKCFNSFQEISNQALTLLSIQDGSYMDSWPIIIDNALTISLSSDELTVSQELLENFSKLKEITDQQLKLLNYWRRGVDLDLLWYWDESYLAFYKTLEYFRKIGDRTRASEGNPKYLNEQAYRIFLGAGFKKVTPAHLTLLKEFIKIRNSGDIAHSKVSQIPAKRTGRLYFTYYDKFWGLYHDIKEISRLAILSYFKIKGFMLKRDGGLYKLMKST